MCAVLKFSQINNDVEYLGGGSLIAPNVILTSAHDLREYAMEKEIDRQNDFEIYNIKVRCGEWDTEGVTEEFDHQERTAQNIIIHPGFKPRDLYNDLAIIVVDSNFDLDQHINTICLPDLVEPSQISWEHCIATGWGKDSFGSTQYQIILRQVEMNMVDHSSCEEKLKTTRLGNHFILDKSFNCAGGVKNIDVCTGDGGGPLVCPGKNSFGESVYFQTGVTSWGIGCGNDNVPGVYVNVSAALCFIDYATRCSLGQDTDLYGLKSCKDWAQRKYCEYKFGIDDVKKQKDVVSNLLLQRTVKRLENLINSYKDMVNSCIDNIFGEVDINCDELDLRNLDYKLL